MHPDTIPDRLARNDWARTTAELDENGWATLPALLTPHECTAMAARYGPTESFRSHVVMARLGYGSGVGRVWPAPLLLRYRAGDWNALHQDLYGEHVFPLQAAILLDRSEKDFTGGEFLLTEQRPRMQSRGSVVPLRQGDAVIFAVNQRPVQGSRGPYRVTMRHGVSALRSGRRHTLGIILHDAT